MKQYYAIGGGELRSFETFPLDQFLASKAKEHAGEKRAYALFIPTASHDFMPYYNTFHKVYTGKLDCKTEVVLCVNHELDMEKTKGKFAKADLIYIGGGDTLFMIEKWKETGILELIKDAYERGVVIAGLSAGAICFFENIYTDSLPQENGLPYAMADALGWFQGTVSPHYNERQKDFDEIVMKNYSEAYGIENNAMLYLEDDVIHGSYSCGGHVFHLRKEKDELKKKILGPETLLQ